MIQTRNQDQRPGTRIGNQDQEPWPGGLGKQATRNMALGCFSEAQSWKKRHKAGDQEPGPGTRTKDHDQEVLESRPRGLYIYIYIYTYTVDDCTVYLSFWAQSV